MFDQAGFVARGGRAAPFLRHLRDSQMWEVFVNERLALAAEGYPMDDPFERKVRTAAQGPARCELGTPTHVLACVCLPPAMPPTRSRCSCTPPASAADQVSERATRLSTRAASSAAAAPSGARSKLGSAWRRTQAVVRQGGGSLVAGLQRLGGGGGSTGGSLQDELPTSLSR